MLKNKLLYLQLILIFIIFDVNGKMSKKIEGGITVSSNSLTYQVSLQINNKHICSGIVISEYHILTSASCVILDNNIIFGNIKIHYGSYDLLEKHSSRVKYLDVSLVIIHPEFNVYNFWINDICILKINTKIIDSKWEDMAILSKGGKIKNKLHASGWGSHPVASKLFHFLQKISISRISQNDCFFKYGVTLSENQYCANGYPQTTARVTWGDGGGPIFEFRKTHGIISILLMTQHSTFLYTFTFPYNEWINEILSDY